MPLTLNHLDYEPQSQSTEPPLVMAHGLFGSARNFHTLARKLAANRRVISVDLRNHGESPWGTASYPEMAADLAETVESVAGRRASVLGHSMGGKTAMALALTRPDLVDELIVADIAPITYEHSHLGYIRAMQDIDLDRISRRSDADPMLAETVPDRMLRSFLLQNLLIEDGRASWRINLDALAEGMERLTGWPEDWPEPRFERPALFLHGGASPYVPADSHDRIRELFPEAKFEAIEGAGHFLHAEKPAEFEAAVDGWLARNS